MAMKTGRKQSIPESLFGKVRQWHEKGYGYRRIAHLLSKHQICTTRGSVHRLIRGLPPYATKSPVG